MIYFSSNNQNELFLKNRVVYVICSKDSGFEFIEPDFFEPLNHICEAPFIPQTELQLTNISKFIQSSHFNESISLLTDYKRVNETHFWSKLTNSWWSQCQRPGVRIPDYGEFSSMVIMDGHKKLRNYISVNAGCVCVGKVRTKISAQIYRILRLVPELMIEHNIRFIAYRLPQ